VWTDRAKGRGTLGQERNTGSLAPLLAAIWCAPPCHASHFRVFHRPMTRFFAMDDRKRLPWRFYGAQRSVLARA